MDQASKRRGRPLPDALNIKPISFNLEEALAVETLYRPNLLTIRHDLKPWEVSLHSRDGAIQKLRFLRVWFDVPQTVFFTAVTYFDLFLARLKVQEKYVSCLTISCFYTAAVKENFHIDVNQLVAVTQSKCTISDMIRMAGILKEKLMLESNKNAPFTTPADFLSIYFDIFEYTSRHCENILKEILRKEHFLILLEVLLADSSCAFFRSSVLSLVLLKIEIEKLMTDAISSKSLFLVGELMHLLAVVREIQHKCKIKTTELVNCSTIVLKILRQYENQGRSKHNQNLVWRFSSSTHNKSKRRRNYHLPLDTIEERTLSFHKKNRT